MHRAILDGIDPIPRRRQGRQGCVSIRSGSGRLDTPRHARFSKRHSEQPVLERYGMSETGTLTYNPMPPGIRKPGTVGVVGINKVRVLDGERKPPSGESRKVKSSHPAQQSSMAIGVIQRQPHRGFHRRVVPHWRPGSFRQRWVSDHHRSNQGRDQPWRRKDRACRSGERPSWSSNGCRRMCLSGSPPDAWSRSGRRSRSPVRA